MPASRSEGQVPSCKWLLFPVPFHELNHEVWFFTRTFLYGLAVMFLKCLGLPNAAWGRAVSTTLARKLSRSHVIAKIKASLVRLSALKSRCSSGISVVKRTLRSLKCSAEEAPDGSPGAALRPNQQASPSARVPQQRSP